jgi:hypothetical protein
MTYKEKLVEGLTSRLSEALEENRTIYGNPFNDEMYLYMLQPYLIEFTCKGYLMPFGLLEDKIRSLK